MFRELDDLEGKRRTSYENNESKTLTPLQRRENSKRSCPTRLTSKCGNWKCANEKKCYLQAYLYHTEHLQLASCYLQ